MRLIHVEYFIASHVVHTLFPLEILDFFKLILIDIICLLNDLIGREIDKWSNDKILNWISQY